MPSRSLSAFDVVLQGISDKPEISGRQTDRVFRRAENAWIRLGHSDVSGDGHICLRDVSFQPELPVFLPLMAGCPVCDDTEPQLSGCLSGTSSQVLQQFPHDRREHNLILELRVSVREIRTLPRFCGQSHCQKRLLKAPDVRLSCRDCAAFHKREILVALFVENLKKNFTGKRRLV